MARQDDFTPAVKEQLARRSGYRCSFLGCGQPTMGPSEESPSSSSNVGMACHISAASSGVGARRYSADDENRSSISNGIWMCYTHGKLIDTDEDRFSVDMLMNWKKIAEVVASIMVEKGVTYDEALKQYAFKDLVTENFSIGGIGIENELVGNALRDCGVIISWGREISSVVRDFIIEHIRNAFIHGNASDITFEVQKDKLIIYDNGTEYNPKILSNSDTKSGGTASVKELNKFRKQVVLVSERVDKQNVVTIARLNELDDILSITNCSYKISFQEFRAGNLEIRVNENCNEIFVVLPMYFSPSDIALMDRKIINLSTETRPITFITEHLSGWVKQMLVEHYPHCNIIEID